MLIDIESLILLLAYKCLPNSLGIKYSFLNKEGLWVHELGKDDKQILGCFYNLKENRVVHANQKWKLWIADFINSNVIISTYLEQELRKKFQLSSK